MEASREVPNKYRTRIENLPECILVYIISFLTTLDSFRTSLVCREWRNLWFQNPSLSFDIIPFHSPSNPYIQTRDSFIQYVNRAISIHPFNHVQKFHLCIDCGNRDHRDIVGTWVLQAINSKVIELDLDFDTSALNCMLSEQNGIILRESYDYIDFHFNFSYLKNSSVKDLKLRRTIIKFPPYLCTTDFQSLQSLFLDDLTFKDTKVNEVIRFCVNLEYLTIRNCYLPIYLGIFSSKLKKCELEFLVTTVVVITAPSLHSVSIGNVCAKICVLKECPNLVVAKVEYEDRTLCNYASWFYLMSSLATIKYLTVPNMYFRRGEFLKKFEKEEDALQCYKFNNLIHLELRTGYTKDDILGICLFLEHSPTLESLVIDYCYDDEENAYSPHSSSEASQDDELQRYKGRNLYCGAHKKISIGFRRGGGLSSKNCGDQVNVVSSLRLLLMTLTNSDLRL